MDKSRTSPRQEPGADDSGARRAGAAPTCADIDECATSNGGCGDPTYYSCTNNPGAVPTCADIDECATNNGGCGAGRHQPSILGAPERWEGMRLTIDGCTLRSSTHSASLTGTPRFAISYAANLSGKGGR